MGVIAYNLAEKSLLTAPGNLNSHR
jgi:hypothetical protein